MENNSYEVLVIGGGPAGLSAALYLARYDRKAALFDVGRGRSTWHQVNHNYLGFPGGVEARQLRELGQQQLEDYAQIQICEHKIESLRRNDDGTFTAIGQSEEWHGQAVIICTGVVDHYPHFEGWSEYVGRSMFWCITCDGYGTKGARVVVVGHTNEAASEALQLQRFTKDVKVLSNSADLEITSSFQERLKRAGIELIEDKIDSVKGTDGYLEAIYTKDGRTIDADQIFNQQGATPQTKLAEDVGVKLSSNGYIATDGELRTNVPFVYAAGDVTRLYSHQISTAVYEGGQAASTANYDLYPADLKDD